MEAKHTKGPWQFTEHGNIAAPSRSFGSQGGIGQFVIATMQPAMTESEQEANALLIAASPELLEALHEAAFMARAWGAMCKKNNGAYPDGYGAAIERIDAAIAKAEGRSNG